MKGIVELRLRNTDAGKDGGGRCICTFLFVFLFFSLICPGHSDQILVGLVIGSVIPSLFLGSSNCQWCQGTDGQTGSVIELPWRAENGKCIIFARLFCSTTSCFCCSRVSCTI